MFSGQFQTQNSLVISILTFDLKLTLAGRGGGGATPNPQTVFPELPENAQSQQAEILALLLYIPGGPDDILKNSGQVRSLTYDVIL